MPITKQAIKKLTADRNRQIHNSSVKASLGGLVKRMRKKPSQKTLTAVFSALDKAAKRNIVHPNKASRLKSRLSRLLAKK